MDCGDCQVKDEQIRRMRARINELEMKEIDRKQTETKRNAAFRKQGRLVNQQGWKVARLERELENKGSLHDEVLHLKEKLKLKRRYAYDDWKEMEYLRKKIKKIKEKKRAARREARRATRRADRRADKLKWEEKNNKLVRDGLRAMLMEEDRMERLEQNKENYRRELELARSTTQAIKAFRKNDGLVEHKKLLLVLSSMKKVIEKITRPLPVSVPTVLRPAEHVEE